MTYRIPIRRVQRDRYLTPEEAAMYREKREKARQEYAAGKVEIGPMTMGDWYDLTCLIADLKEARQNKGLDLAELSRRIGIPESELATLESGPRQDVNLHALMQYARAVGKRLTLTSEDTPQPATTDR